MVLDLRSVNVETGEIEFVTNATDKSANLLALIHKIAVKTNAGLKLPDIPKQVGEARAAKDEKIPFYGRDAVLARARGEGCRQEERGDDPVQPGARQLPEL